MRLWHKDLICVLPREQLTGAWRECSAIAGNIITKGTPNHILVNKIMDYPMNHFITYAAAVRAEMTSRGYRTMNSVWDKITKVANGSYTILPIEEIYPEWMNEEYLAICYYNLKEKYMCGGIKEEEFKRIDDLVWGDKLIA